MIGRRSFLRGLVLSSATGLILPTAAQALILGDRYERLVTAIRTLLDSNTRLEGYRSEHNLVKIDTPRYQAQLANGFAENDRNFDEYLRIILEDFGDTTAITADYEGISLRVAMLLNQPITIDIMSEDELRQHEDIIIAIAVTKSLLSVHRIRVKAATERFNVFAARYRGLILDSNVVVRKHEEQIAWEARHGKRSA